MTVEVPEFGSFTEAGGLSEAGHNYLANVAEKINALEVLTEGLTETNADGEIVSIKELLEVERLRIDDLYSRPYFAVEELTGATVTIPDNGATHYRIICEYSVRINQNNTAIVAAVPGPISVTGAFKTLWHRLATATTVNQNLATDVIINNEFQITNTSVNSLCGNRQMAAAVYSNATPGAPTIATNYSILRWIVISYFKGETNGNP